MEIHFPIFTKPILCKMCGQYTTMPVWVTKEVGKGTMQFAFCNNDHAQAFYLGHLKEAK